MKQGDTNDRTAWTSMKTIGESRCSERVDIPCSACESTATSDMTWWMEPWKQDFMTNVTILTFLSSTIPFLDSNTPSSPAYGVYMSQFIRFSRTCNSYQDFLHPSVLLTRKRLSQGFIETRMRSTLKILTLTYRVSVTTMANDICRPWYYCHEYVSFLSKT